MAIQSYRDLEVYKLSFRLAVEQYDVLGKKLNRFLQSIVKNHQEPYR